jgi:uncharacterized protein YcfJ
VATTEPTQTPQQTVRIEVEQSWPAPTVPAAGPPAGDGDVVVTPPAEEGQVAERSDGAVLLLADARTAFILINHVRKRALVRVFGVPPEHVNVVTAIGLVLIADAAHDRVVRLLGSSPAPTRGDALIAGASVRALVGGIAGPSLDEMRGLGALITVAVAARAMGPAAARSMHALRSNSHRLTLGFHGRYGYLVDPGHWRERRARAREARQGRHPPIIPIG